MYQISPISPRIKKIKERREVHDHGNVILCAERTGIYTKYYKSHEAEMPQLKRAGALYEWCQKHEVRLEDDEMFVANLGRDWRSAQLYVEWGTASLEAAMKLPEDEFIKNWQSPGVRAYVSPEDKEIFTEAVEYWRDRSIPAHVHTLLPAEFDRLYGDNCTSFGNRKRAMTAQRPQGHFCANYCKVIDKGWNSIVEDAQQRIDAVQGKTFGDNAGKYVTWRASQLVAKGAIVLTQRYADLVAEKAKEATGERKAELEQMADSLKWIAGNPARTYWEALQIILIYQLLLHTDAQAHGVTLGRIDQYCGHFLEKELAEGTMTVERAQELADAFILKLGDYFVFSVTGIASNNTSYHYECGGHHFTVGGLTPDGEDATNTLTLLFLQTYTRLYLTIPSLSVRIHKNTPYTVWEHAVESSKAAGGMPTFENDEIIIPALVERGMSQRDANNYCIIGCVEPAGTGCEWSACGSSGGESFSNLVGVLNMAIHNGTNPMSGCDSGLRTGYLYDYKTFEEFQEAFIKQMEYFLNWHISFVNFYELAYSTFLPSVAATATMDGCMESGKDVLVGGAKYNSTGFTALGTANVADSLITIKKLVFDEKKVTARELYDALVNNWKGYEDLQQYIINDLPHYGNSIKEVDDLAVWALSAYADHMNNARGPRGKWRGGTFTVTTHLEFGRLTCATPDGREDSAPLAEAISSRQGFDKNGPTSYVLSAAKLPHYKLGNGDMLNIRFSPSTVQGEDGDRKLSDLIATYFGEGGMQVQFNVVSTDTLYKAQAKPDDYKNLIVRIAGFSVYFVEIGKALQDDFISRAEHAM